MGSLFPPILYKYRSFDDPGWRLLEKGEVFFSSPGRLNDLHDTAAMPLFHRGTKTQLYRKNLTNLRLVAPTLSRKERRIRARTLGKTMYANRNDKKRLELCRQDIAEQTNKMVGVLSLSGVRDSEPMWAHYADSHQGFCAGFDTRRFLAFFDAAFWRGAPLSLYPVVYRDKYPELDPFTMSDEELMLTKLLTKSRAWQYENEYRILCANRPDFPLDIPLNIISTVILGARCGSPNRERVISVLKNRKGDVSLDVVRPADDRYGLEFDAIAL